jgi:enoyl-CoA hydratase/carnithine racemase
VPGTYETIRVEIDAPVATVTLTRPDALNAITPTMLDELVDAFGALATDAGSSVVVLTGEGRAFCAGVDLKALAGRSLTDGKVGDVLDVPARRLTTLLTTMPPVVIAKVNGPCFTGGLELALACDLVVAANEAIFGDTHAKFGLRPTWGMSARLPQAVGVTRARLLSYTAQTFTGADAAAWGLAAVACPRDELDTTVADLAARIAANSSGSLAAYKDLYRAGADLTLTEGLAHEAGTEYPIDDTEPRIASFR